MLRNLLLILLILLFTSCSDDQYQKSDTEFVSVLDLVMFPAKYEKQVVTPDGYYIHLGEDLGYLYLDAGAAERKASRLSILVHSKNGENIDRLSECHRKETSIRGHVMKDGGGVYSLIAGLDVIC